MAFVSVVFEAEFRLLELQARSMARFLSRQLPAEIIVIDNSARGMDTGMRDHLLAAYGGLADLVRIVRPRDICSVPGAIGWRSQQVLKLCVVELLKTERYVVLDAKNIFIDEPSSEFFENAAGKPRVNAYSYRSHPLRPVLEHVLAYLGIDPVDHVDRFTATVTPFVLETAIVRELIAGIEQNSGLRFAQEFVRNSLTEFFLYSGWIIASGRALEDVYDFHQVSCPNVWPHSANLSGVKAAIRQANEGHAPIFTVHRKALGALDPQSLDVLAGFWTEREAFPSVEDARSFITDFRAAFEREERIRRLRDLPHKATAFGRELRRTVQKHRANR